MSRQKHEHIFILYGDESPLNTYVLVPIEYYKYTLRPNNAFHIFEVFQKIFKIKLLALFYECNTQKDFDRMYIVPIAFFGNVKK